MKISGLGSYSVSISSCSSSVDEEEKEIMRRLYAYGIQPTGNKITDRAKLREIELKLAQQENTVTNKFLTVSRMEQEKIQEKKQENKCESNNTIRQEKFEGSKALGEQIYTVLLMKKKKKSSVK